MYILNLIIFIIICIIYTFGKNLRIGCSSKKFKIIFKFIKKYKDNNNNIILNEIIPKIINGTNFTTSEIKKCLNI